MKLNFKNFKKHPKTKAYKSYTCGDWLKIQDKLIKLTGKLTRKNQNHLIPYIQEIQNDLIAGKPKKAYYFGFFGKGVNGTEYIEIDGEHFARWKYKQIWKLSVVPVKKDAEDDFFSYDMRLYRVEYNPHPDF